MQAPRSAEDSPGGKRGLSRRGLLGGIGAGGLATAATVFGFTTPASATIQYGCCHLCCRPNGHTLSQCETGPAYFYVWSCTESNGTTCKCCEHHSPCRYGCNSTHYSVYRCT